MSASRTPRRTNTVVIGLAIAIAVTTAVASILGLLVRQAAQADDARSAALTAARLHAPTIMSFDYRTLDRDFAAARKLLSGDAVEQFEATVVKAVAPTAEQVKASLRTEVAASSVVSATADRVVVLLFLNQTVSHTQIPAPRTDQTRAQLALTKRDGTWLISKVELL